MTSFSLWLRPLFALVFFCACPQAQAADTVKRPSLRQALPDVIEGPSLSQMLDETVKTRRIQTRFPERKVEKEGRGGNGVGGGSGSPSVVSDAAATTMLYVSVAVFAVMLILTILDNLRPPKPGEKKIRPPTPEEADLLRSRMNTVRLEGDKLAAMGDYAEAMHALLLQSLDEMRRRLGVPISISLTSREILDRIRLEPRAHDALADIVDCVEISYFGSHAPGADEYASCRRSFTELTNILARGRTP